MWRPRPGHIITTCVYPLNAFMLFRNVALYGEDVNAEAQLRSQVTKMRKMLAMLIADHTMACSYSAFQPKQAA